MENVYAIIAVSIFALIIGTLAYFKITGKSISDNIIFRIFKR